MPDDARRSLLTRFFDHAPMFPPASLPPAEALAEDRRARASEHSWMLGRLVWRTDMVSELPQDEGRALAFVGSEGGMEAHGDTWVYLEGRAPDYVASLAVRAKIRCGGTRIPSVEELAEFVRGCRQVGVVFKATAGLHHAYPTKDGEHGFLNLLAAAVFGSEEEALREGPGAFELDSSSFRWRGRRASPSQLADVRASLFNSIGTCSFFEPVAELERLGVI